MRIGFFIITSILALSSLAASAASQVRCFDVIRGELSPARMAAYNLPVQPNKICIDEINGYAITLLNDITPLGRFDRNRIITNYTWGPLVSIVMDSTWTNLWSRTHRNEQISFDYFIVIEPPPTGQVNFGESNPDTLQISEIKN